MSQSFKVAIMGMENSDRLSFFNYTYGIHVYDLTVDEICQTLLETAEGKAAVYRQPIAGYTVTGGGRSYPMISREEIAQVMQGVDIMVIKILTNFPDSLGYQFSYQLAEENLLDKCRYVVMRVIGDVPKKNAAYFGGYNISQFFKGKNYTITDATAKKFKKNKSQNKLMELKSDLNGESVKEALSQPIKETMTAGKNLIRAGQRFGRWILSLV